MITEKLRQLGWSEYEAKCYIALLKTGPATGYRVAKESGVPSAKVYEVLSRLADKGAVKQDQLAKLFVPVAVAELLGGIRAKQTQIIDQLQDDLAQFVGGSADVSTETITGWQSILGRAVTYIAAATSRISYAVPAVHEGALRESLQEAELRVVEIHLTRLPDFAATQIGRAHV